MNNVHEIETKRVAEQQRLDSLKKAGERNRLGQFATPPTLARDIARYARGLWRNRADRICFLDPAVGTGSFFSALKDDSSSELIERGAGFEIDAAFAAAAKRLWEVGVHSVQLALRDWGDRLCNGHGR